MAIALTTPNSTPGLDLKKTRGGKTRTFKDFEKNDRQKVRKALNKLVRTAKWKDMKVNDREAAIRNRLIAVLDERERSSYMTTARHEYPERFDQAMEEDHFVAAYAHDIGLQIEQDDPEPLPKGRKIKQEPRDDDDGDDGATETDEQSEESSEYREGSSSAMKAERGEEKSDGPIIYKVVNRGFVISSEKPGVKALHPGVRPSSQHKLNTASLGGRRVACGITKDQKWKHAKRAWKWIDGKMVVWPALDAAC